MKRSECCPFKLEAARVNFTFKNKRNIIMKRYFIDATVLVMLSVPWLFQLTQKRSFWKQLFSMEQKFMGLKTPLNLGNRL